jgi:hypothetical protein
VFLLGLGFCFAFRPKTKTTIAALSSAPDDRIVMPNSHNLNIHHRSEVIFVIYTTFQLRVVCLTGRH